VGVYEVRRTARSFSQSRSARLTQFSTEKLTDWDNYLGVVLTVDCRSERTDCERPDAPEGVEITRAIRARDGHADGDSNIGAARSRYAHRPQAVAAPDG
jgi:hypothetical protein